MPAEDKAIVNSLHETALALGYTAKISSVGKKFEDWKCEYVATKQGTQMFWETAQSIVKLHCFPRPRIVKIMVTMDTASNTQRSEF